MSVPRWLEQYWQEQLAPVLEAVDATHAEPLAEVFAEALKAWRARPQVRAANTIASYVTMTREWVRSLPLTERNQVINLVTQQPEHVALTYFTLTREEWAEGKEQRQQQVHTRNEQILPLPDPERLVETITTLLDHRDWEAVAAGLAAASGRRIGEVLLSGSLEPKTAYTLWFAGRLKMKGRPDQRFEIPTIVEAERVIHAWERIRTHREIVAMQLPTQANPRALGQINTRLYPRVRQAVTHFFGELVPALDEEGAAAEISTHRLRSVYAALAVWAYCPLWVDPDRYGAASLGHGLFTKEGIERLNPSTEEYYHRYVVADGRRGVRLGEPGVEVLERFARSVEAAEAAQEKERRGMPKARKARQEPPETTKTGFSSLRPKVGTRREIYFIAQQLGIEWKRDDEVLQVLIKTYHEHEQCMRQQAEERVAVEITPSMVGLSQEQAQEATRLSGLPTFAGYVQQAVDRDRRRMVNLSKSVEQKQQEGKQGLGDAPLSKLEHVRRAPEANERLRRAIAAIVDYNRQCTNPNLLWYINQKLLREFTGSAPDYINRILEVNQEYLRCHHEHHGITPVHNRIPTKHPIRETVQIPELPTELSSLTGLVVPPEAEPEPANEGS